MNSSSTVTVPPPPGVVPDFAHPTDAGHVANILVLVVCDVLATVLFVVRCWVKTLVVPKMMMEDWTCLMAWASLMIYTGTVFMMTRYGEGYHEWEVRHADLVQINKWLYASTVVYCPAAFFTKVTLLLLIARVFAVKKRFAKAIYVYIVFLVAAYIPIEVIKILICVPIRAFWEPGAVEGAVCFNQDKVFISDIALAILTDAVILVLPIPLTWSLNMPLRKKVKIMLLLGAGGAATGVTCFRMAKVVQFESSHDVTVDFVILDMFTCIEITIGLVCACIPSLSQLIKKYRTTPVSPNTPRTSIGWDTWTNKVKKYYDWCYRGREASRTLVGDNSNLNPTHITTSMAAAMDFDVEMAMQTGQPLLSVNSSSMRDLTIPTTNSTTMPRTNNTRHRSLGSREGHTTNTDQLPIREGEEGCLTPPPSRRGESNLNNGELPGIPHCYHHTVVIPNRIWDGVKRHPNLATRSCP